MARIRNIARHLWSGLGTKASAVARHISYGQGSLAVWTPRKYDQLALEGYQKNAVAYRCVDEIAKGVSQVPILLYRVGADGKRQEVTSHPVLRLLRRPNPTQSKTRLLYELTSFLAIAGNAYLEGVGPSSGPNAGTFKELWTKRPDRMKVIPGTYGVAKYRHEVNGLLMDWDVDPLTQRSAIKHFKLFHPLNDWYGMSPIEAAAMDIDTHNQTREWNKSLLDNSARPDGVLTTEKALSDVQFNRLKEQIDARYSGSRNAGRPMLLENGLSWQQLAFSPRDMDFINSKHTSARDICSAFGVPPMLLGIPGDNTYSNQREARLAFFDVTVQFYLQLIVDELNAWFFGGTETLDGEGEELFLGYDLDAVPAMALRREQLFERASKATFLRINERRELAGYGPIEGGDVLLVPGTEKPLEHALIEPPDPLEMERVRAEARAGGPQQPGSGKTPPKPKPGQSKTLSAMRDLREAMGFSEQQLAIWLMGEGLSEADAYAKAREVCEDHGDSC